MLSGDRRTIIGIMGGAHPDLPDEVLDQAERAGRCLAEAGAVLLCGGRTGIMEAAARGAKSIPGGETLAVLPGSDPDRANEYIDLALATGMGNGRNVINILSCDAVIAFPGGAGTLSEMALALKCAVPLITFATWSVEAPSLAIFQDALDQGLHQVDSPEAAVDLALQLAGCRMEGPETVKAQILEILNSRARTVSTQELETFLDYYLESEEVSLSLEGRRHTGKKAIRTALEQQIMVRGRGGSKMEIIEKSLNLVRLPGRAQAAAYGFRLKDTNNQWQEWTGSSLLLRTAGTYRIMVEHFSRAAREN